MVEITYRSLRSIRQFCIDSALADAVKRARAMNGRGVFCKDNQHLTQVEWYELASLVLLHLLGEGAETAETAAELLGEDGRYRKAHALFRRILEGDPSMAPRS